MGHLIADLKPLRQMTPLRLLQIQSLRLLTLFYRPSLVKYDSRQSKPFHIDTTGFQEPLPIPPAPANPLRGPLPFVLKGLDQQLLLPPVTGSTLSSKLDLVISSLILGTIRLKPRTVLLIEVCFLLSIYHSLTTDISDNPINEETLVPLVQTLATTSQQSASLAHSHFAVPQLTSLHLES
jgi:hypothetical protein